jgi:hypothetical protein
MDADKAEDFDFAEYLDSRAPRAWDRLWNSKISGLIREEVRRGGADAAESPPRNTGSERAAKKPKRRKGEPAETTNDTPAVKWEELERNIYDFKPYPYALIRHTRRLFARFSVEAFLEDRSFGDYRNQFSQEMVALVAEAESTQRLAEKLINYLEALTSCLGESGGLSLLGMRKALERVREQAEAVLLFKDRGFAARLFERLRILHFGVQKAWGTWPRRVLWPALWAISGVLFAAVLNAWVGLVYGTGLFFRLALIIPILGFGASYFGARSRVTEKISKVSSLLAAFDPEPTSDGLSAREYTIWQGNEILEKKIKAYNLVYNDGPNASGDRAFATHDVKISNAGWVAALAVLGGAFVLIPAIGLLCSGGVPTYSVDISTPLGLCEYARGRLLWPGPQEILIWPKEKDWRIARIPRNRISGITRYTDENSNESFPNCSQLGKAQASTSANLTFVSNGVGGHRGVVTIPFVRPRNPIDCNIQADVDGVKVSPSVYEYTLRRLGDALSRCKATVDVRGFASMVEFKGCRQSSDDENRQLADERRLSVLRALGFQTASVQSLSSRGIRLKPLAISRWSSYQHMRDFDSVNDLDSSKTKNDVADLSQRVEIWIDDFGDCSAADIPLSFK